VGKTAEGADANPHVRTADTVHELVSELDYPMFIVTAASATDRAGVLVGFATQCSIDPPRFLLCLSEQNKTFRVAQEAEVLVHIVPDEAEALAGLFGGRTGDQVDKLAHREWSPGPGGAPVLRACPNWFAGLMMEILNATPDSESDLHRLATREEQLRHGEEMVRAGADIIDVGGESSRTDRPATTPAQEAQRVVPVIRGLAERGVAVSVDTWRVSVAAAAVEAGAAIISDVSGLADLDMARLAARSGSGLVIMHTRAAPPSSSTSPATRIRLRMWSVSWSTRRRRPVSWGSRGPRSSSTRSRLRQDGWGVRRDPAAARRGRGASATGAARRLAQVLRRDDHGTAAAPTSRGHARGAGM